MLQKLALQDTSKNIEEHRNWEILDFNKYSWEKRGK